MQLIILSAFLLRVIPVYYNLGLEFSRLFLNVETAVDKSILIQDPFTHLFWRLCPYHLVFISRPSLLSCHKTVSDQTFHDSFASMLVKKMESFNIYSSMTIRKRHLLIKSVWYGWKHQNECELTSTWSCFVNLGLIFVVPAIVPTGTNNPEFTELISEIWECSDIRRQKLEGAK